MTAVGFLSEDLEKELERAAADPPGTLAAARQCIERLAARVRESIRSAGVDPEHEALMGLGALERQCRDALDEINLLAPWNVLPAPPERFAGISGLAAIPTLREIAALASTLMPTLEHALAADITPAERESLAALATLVRQGAASRQ